VSTSRQVVVTEVRRLQSASYTGLRVSLKGDGITARDLLTGDLGGWLLVGIVRQWGRVQDLVGTYWAGVYLVSEYSADRCLRLAPHDGSPLLCG